MPTNTMRAQFWKFMPNPAMDGFVTRTRMRPSWKASNASALASGDQEPSTLTASSPIADAILEASSLSPHHAIHCRSDDWMSSTARSHLAASVCRRTAERPPMPPRSVANS